MSACLSVWLLYQFRDTSWKKDKNTGIHILQQSKRQKPTQTKHTKPENSPTEKKFLLRMAISRWQNRYSEEYEAHVHILHTNNFFQVSQASQGWTESGKSVRSARMTYLPPLFRLTSPFGTGVLHLNFNFSRCFFTSILWYVFLIYIYKWLISFWKYLVKGSTL
jgi:hypothetical protein